MTKFILISILNLLNSLNLPSEKATKDVMILARLACSEAGYDLEEGRRVLRVVYNRSQRRGTTVVREATRRGQFYLKNCTGKHKDWLKWGHIKLAIQAVAGKIKAKEAVINKTSVIYFATSKRLAANHPRCKGYTIREVWEWSGLKHVLTTRVGHEYFEKLHNRAGCPHKEANGR